MKKIISLLLISFLGILLPATASLAGSRYHAKQYYGGHGGYYRPYHHYRHSHHSDHFLVNLGVGLVAGAVVGSLLYQPPVERTVIYSSPPPVIVPSSPVVVGPPPEYSTDREVLRHVRPTVRLLNLRSGPGLDDEVIGQAAYGEILGVIGAAPDWLYVKTQTGQYGWVMMQYTQVLEGPVG